MNFNANKLSLLANEIIKEQHIPPSTSTEEIINYIKDGIYSINEDIGYSIDYDSDLTAKSLLKNYCFYARYKRLAEFKERYSNEYVRLQFKYNRDTSI